MRARPAAAASLLAGTSYARYINREWAEQSGDSGWCPEMEKWDANYHPSSVDDPELKQGKHSIITNSNTDSNTTMKQGKHSLVTNT